MKSGLLGAKAVMDAIRHEKAVANTYAELFKASWLFKRPSGSSQHPSSVSAWAYSWNALHCI